MSTHVKRETNSPRDHPFNVKAFYYIEPQEDGTVDVYLAPDAIVYETDVGVREYDISFRVVKGVVPWSDMENDIRARYDAWCKSGTLVFL